MTLCVKLRLVGSLCWLLTSGAGLVAMYLLPKVLGEVLAVAVMPTVASMLLIYALCKSDEVYE